MIHLLAEAVTTAPTSGGYEALVIGAVVAGSQALTEGCKAIVAALKKRNGNGNGAGNGKSDNGVACIECRAIVKRTHEMISATDGDGLPLVYGGHVVAKKLDRVADELHSVTAELKRRNES